jgi:hypothetical protein
MSELTCPVCGSNNTGSNWVDNATVGEYQKGECYSCGGEWNECARDYQENASLRSGDDYERGAE